MMRKSIEGLTLLELMVSLGIFMIILAFGIPFSSILYKKNQLQVIIDNIKSAIQTSQLNAMLQNETLILAPLSETGDWSNGVVIFSDNAQHKYTPTSKIYYKWQWPKTNIHIQWQGFQSQHYLLFSPNIRQNALNGYFLLQNNLKQVKLTVNRLGRVKEL